MTSNSNDIAVSCSLEVVLPRRVSVCTLWHCSAWQVKLSWGQVALDQIPVVAVWYQVLVQYVDCKSLQVYRQLYMKSRLTHMECFI